MINDRAPHWRVPAEDMKREFAKGLTSTDSADHVIHHEIGHALHVRNVGLEEANFQRGSATLRQRARNVGPEVSKYATPDPAEFVAETYAARMLGKWDEFSSAVKRLYNDLGGP